MRCMRNKGRTIKKVPRAKESRQLRRLGLRAPLVTLNYRFLNVLLDHNQYVTCDSFKKYDWG